MNFRVFKATEFMELECLNSEGYANCCAGCAQERQLPVTIWVLLSRGLELGLSLALISE